MSELMLKSILVPFLPRTGCSRRLFYTISGPQLVEMSLFWRGLNFCMLCLWGCLFACVSTSSTLFSIREMIMLQVFHLRAWSRSSVFRLQQTYLLSPGWECKILLVVRLSWSLMLSCGLKDKAKHLSLLQLRMISMQQLPYLRLLPFFYFMMLDILRLWLPWALFSGRPSLSVSELSSASLISKSVSSTIIHLKMIRIDCYCYFFETIYFYSCFWIFVNFITLDFLYYIYLCPVETLRGSIFNCDFSILCLPFLLLRQKGRVFLFLGRECIFNWSSDFCPKMVKEGVCQFCCLHSVDKITIM
jgi:hypothetical protein